MWRGVMVQNKTFLAIIPARSGSKGLQDKNIKEMNQKPLMAYTIEACLKAKVFEEIFVSTDSIQYAEIAKRYGAQVPFLRPDNLALDQSTTTDVILHVINEMKNRGKTFDCLVLLQPTSPLRTEKHIKESIEIFFKKEADTVISVCKLLHPSALNVIIDNSGALIAPYCGRESVRRQDFTQEYQINGAIYITGTEFFLQHKSFYSEKTFPYIMEPIHSIDIDDAFLFRVGELLLKYGL
jgi:N-acylneuraminate cytidylyltransferase/CMP-N,N'-diacetyllegionaminic acid synthase